jgi:hypothetical protein
MGRKRIIIAGGSGFIGSALVREFSRRDYEVVILTRQPRGRNDGVREILWDGRQPGEWIQILDGAEAVINLAGRRVDRPHTPDALRQIIASRVDSVNALGAALTKIKTPPQVWVQASAVGFYGDTGNKLCDESASSGNDSLAEICRQWEGAFASVVTPQTRRVTLRIGFVLGQAGGALPVLIWLTKMFLGGAIGKGRQYISWIHLDEAVEEDKITGVFNAVGPAPATNAEFMRELRHALHRPWCPPAPAMMVKLAARLIGLEPSLALVSQRCAPRRWAEAGFAFQFPELTTALKACVP